VNHVADAEIVKRHIVRDKIAQKHAFRENAGIGVAARGDDGAVIRVGHFADCVGQGGADIDGQQWPAVFVVFPDIGNAHDTYSLEISCFLKILGFLSFANEPAFQRVPDLRPRLWRKKQEPNSLVSVGIINIQL
jgi:hypothetical protein